MVHEVVQSDFLNYSKTPVKLPKGPYITIDYDDRVHIGPIEDEGYDGCELSFENLLLSIALSSEQLESMTIDYMSCNAAHFDELWKIVMTIPSLQDFQLVEECSGACGHCLSWPEAVSKLLLEMTTLRKFTLDIMEMEESQAKLLVDALLQTQTLQTFNLTIGAESDDPTSHVTGVMEQLCRYLKTSTNVLARLEMLIRLDDKDVRLLADLLGDNKSMTYLRFRRERPEKSHCLPLNGVGSISDALLSNTVLEALVIQDTYLWSLEMTKLADALTPQGASGLQPNSSLLTLELEGCKVDSCEGIESMTAMVKSNTSLVKLDLTNLKIQPWEEIQ